MIKNVIYYVTYLLEYKSFIPLDSSLIEKIPSEKN